MWWCVYTKLDLGKIDKDIERLRAGERVRSVTYGEQKVSYADVTLDELVRLRQKIKQEFKSNELVQKRRMIFATSKGLSDV